MATSSVERVPILVVAALGRELAKLRSDTPRFVELLETGEGIANAMRRLEARLAGGPLRAVLSIGFAGALTASLKAGDLVIPREVRTAAAQPDPVLFEAAQNLRSLGFATRSGIAITSDEIVWTAESKRALASTLPSNENGLVDMESTVIAEVCGRRRLPFLIVRSITDLLDEDLPLNFNLYRDSEGRVDSTRVVKAALLKPNTIAGLVELRRRSELCAERMAVFMRSLLPFIDHSS